MLGLVTALAYGADGWIGGGSSIEIGYDGGSAALVGGGEVELDARLEAGPMFLRLDYDLKYDLFNPGLANLGTYAGPVPLPEWAIAQFSFGGPRLRLGILNPAIGLEDWDDRLNYLPTTSASFDWGLGRFAGADAGWTLESGVDLFVYGGYDVDYEAVGVGAGVLYEGDALGVWSGFAAYPSLQQYQLIPSGEWYFNNLTLSFDSIVGLKSGQPFVTTETLVNLFPDGPASPVARVEVNGDPNGTLDDPSAGAFVPVATASLGVNFWPTRLKYPDDALRGDAVKVQLEGKLFVPNSRAGQTPYPGVFLSISAWRPEPDAYTARYAEE
jgi:hypothetical protein